ncbi:hypothetical protein LNP25_23665 [Klebsiella variicola subsp. variicola]|nr:hypothetical protein [Klebsiella variicola subsp. variicola]
MVVGIAVGCVAAGLSGQFHLHSLGEHSVSPADAVFPFGFQLNSAILCRSPWCRWFLYSGGGGRSDANSLISQQSIDDHAFRNRLKGGIPADGVSCMVAAMLCAFPNTTFAQNNGVIQMTGVASRWRRTLHWRDSDPAWTVSPGGRNRCGRSRRRCWGAPMMVMFGCVVAGIRLLPRPC